MNILSVTGIRKFLTSLCSIDFHRPGVSIKSPSNAGPDATTTKTGTSVAAAFVSGVAALYLEAFPNISPAELLSRMRYGAASSMLLDATNFPNLLVSTEFIDDFSPAPVSKPPLVTKTPAPVPTRRACGGLLVSACIENSDCCTGQCWQFRFFFGLKRCWIFSNI